MTKPTDPTERAHAASAPRVQFGLFDWLDESGRGMAQTYAERLRMLELADRLGFACYHLAEHHATELSTVPSPNVFLSAVAQRTQRIRLGPLSVILPLYNPLRLLEEICMLDQLSGGRLELGISRGSQGEHIDGDPAKARAVFNEALQIILMGLRTGQLEFHGTYFAYDGVTTRLHPLQRPYPPLWYPTSSLESIPWVAAQNFNTAFSVHLAPSFDLIADMLRRYQSELAAHRNDPNRLNGHVAQPRYGFSMHVYVADTDSQAIDEARPAYAAFSHNYNYRMVRRGQPERYEKRPTLERQLETGRILVGSPATVSAQLRRYLEQSGANYFLGCFSFGSLPLEQMLRSVELFAREVIPAVTQPAAATAAGRRTVTAAS